MLQWLLIALCISACASQKVFRVPDGQNTLRMVHLSDVHRGKDFCNDILPPWRSYPCDGFNTTQHIRSILKTEAPDLVVHTGDVIDNNSKHPIDEMLEIYGLSMEAGVPWAASLGNHDEEAFNITREEVMKHITSFKESTGRLSEMGPVNGSFGNFYVDVLGKGDALVARLVFFDSRIDTVHVCINDAQVDWFTNLTKTLPPAPTLAFYHIPLKEYQDAMDAKLPISGSYHEHICIEEPSATIFPALKAGNVIAGFCGHDHTNDFCVDYEGVQLCYEGSPSYTCYGSLKNKYMRRARVTELQLNADGNALANVQSWKRVDGGGAVAGGIVDKEILWSKDGHAAKASQEASRRAVSDETCATLKATPGTYSTKETRASEPEISI
eukprot:TRINITY_DN15860_c0_g1_i1.p1 TRINITY_DN15860_c0_g1~~TRINITY_DN15860_c0_g1_i1.p1  ORF type:complete len:392 (+),score=69.20 TRINITY_DN15860_c0_g1_i1:30-1178(+)